MKTSKGTGYVVAGVTTIAGSLASGFFSKKENPAPPLVQQAQAYVQAQPHLEGLLNIEHLPAEMKTSLEHIQFDAVIKYNTLLTNPDYKHELQEYEQMQNDVLSHNTVEIGVIALGSSAGIGLLAAGSRRRQTYNLRQRFFGALDDIYERAGLEPSRELSFFTELDRVRNRCDVRVSGVGVTEIFNPSLFGFRSTEEMIRAGRTYLADKITMS